MAGHVRRLRCHVWLDPSAGRPPDPLRPGQDRPPWADSRRSRRTRPGMGSEDSAGHPGDQRCDRGVRTERRIFSMSARGHLYLPLPLRRWCGPDTGLKLTEIGTPGSPATMEITYVRSEPPLDREAKRRLAVIRHVEEVSGNVALTWVGGRSARGRGFRRRCSTKCCGRRRRPVQACIRSRWLRPRWFRPCTGPVRLTRHDLASFPVCAPVGSWGEGQPDGSTLLRWMPSHEVIDGTVQMVLVGYRVSWELWVT